ncbi:MAG: hypothetical protein II938_04270 [Alphaproteobacteria bacterium]|nr:hypothetical protein [Alphaproteobacteria bacterium]
MKKLFVLIGLTLAMSSTSAYAGCTGGTTFNTTINSLTLCKSTASMNWWSAFAWCKANGMHLATFQDAFGDATLAYNSNCTLSINSNMYNMSGINGYPWLALPGDDNSGETAFAVCGVSTGGWHRVNKYSRTTARPALCAPNTNN